MPNPVEWEGLLTDITTSSAFIPVIVTDCSDVVLAETEVTSIVTDTCRISINYETLGSSIQHLVLASEVLDYDAFST